MYYCWHEVTLVSQWDSWNFITTLFLCLFIPRHNNDFRKKWTDAIYQNIERMFVHYLCRTDFWHYSNKDIYYSRIDIYILLWWNCTIEWLTMFFLCYTRYLNFILLDKRHLATTIANVIQTGKRDRNFTSNKNIYSYILTITKMRHYFQSVKIRCNVAKVTQISHLYLMINTDFNVLEKVPKFIKQRTS